MQNSFAGLRLQKFPIRIASKVGITQYIPEWYYNNYHSKVISYLQTEYSYLINEYSNKLNLVNGNIPKSAWIMWWQGMDNAPQIVKRCYESVLRNFDGEITVITKDNFEKYTNLHKDILALYYSGSFSTTKLSDIIRMNLLNLHGGIWMDSTVFLTRKLEVNDYGHFYTLKKNNNHAVNISRGMYTGWFIGSAKDYLPFEFILRFHEEYFKKEKFLIDYLLIDYAFYIAYLHNIGGFAADIDRMKYNNPKPYGLDRHINNKINPDLTNEIFNTGTNVFKLSYKHSIKNTPQTYGHLILGGTLGEVVDA